MSGNPTQYIIKDGKLELTFKGESLVVPIQEIRDEVKSMDAKKEADIVKLANSMENKLFRKGELK